MRVLFDENIENEDFLELILNQTEYRNLLTDLGICQEFPDGIFNRRSLNISVRVEEDKEEDEYYIEEN